MAIADFEQLCEGFCDIAAMTTPALVPDEHGALAFTLRLHEVAVTVMEFVRVRPGMAYLMAEFGPMPQERAQDGWRALLDINRRMAGSGCAAFSRHPPTGQVLMQASLALADATAVDVYQQVCKMVDAAVQWRESCFLDGRAGGSLPACMPAQGGNAAPLVTLGILGAKVTVRRLEPVLAGLMSVEVSLGQPAPGTQAALIHAAMEANFSWMTHEHEPCCSLDASSGEWLMQSTQPLSLIDAPEFRRVAEQAVRQAKNWLAGLAQKHVVPIPDWAELA